MPSRLTNPVWLGFIGDYLGNAVGPDGIAHPVWTEVRPPDQVSEPGALSTYGGTIYTRAVRA